MGEIRCEDVLQWLRTAVQAKDLVPMPAIQAHVAGCPICQAVMLLLVGEVTNSPISPTIIDCEHCRAELPTFIEWESEAPARAIRDYPQVWWHLWTCDTCAETYRLTRVLVEAEQHGVIGMPDILRIGAVFTPQLQILLRLTRAFLTRALPAPLPLARIMRGHSDGPIVLSQRKIVADRNLVLSVEKQPNRDWAVRVVLTPPLAGWLVLKLGEAEFRARFDAQGIAVADNVPAELLTGTAGPELVVGIETDV